MLLKLQYISTISNYSAMKIIQKYQGCSLIVFNYQMGLSLQNLFANFHCKITLTKIAIYCIFGCKFVFCIEFHPPPPSSVLSSILKRKFDMEIENSKATTLVFLDSCLSTIIADCDIYCNFSSKYMFFIQSQFLTSNLEHFEMIV